MSVETPWKTYDSMIIEAFSASQDEASIFETTFNLVFKEMRFVGVNTFTGEIKGRVGQQKAAVKEQGDTGKKQSFLKTGKEWAKAKLNAGATQ